MPRQQQQIPLLSQEALGGRRGGGPRGASAAEIALSGFAKSQDASMKKLMDTFGKMQETQAEQGDAAARGVTDALNQIVARQKEVTEKEERKGERMEERRFQEEFVGYQAELQKNMQEEQLSMMEAVKGQRDATRDYIVEFDRQRRTVLDSVDAVEKRVEDMWLSGLWDQAPNGPSRMAKIKNYLATSRLLGENHYRPEYLQNAKRLLNDSIQDILAGRDPMDLTELQVDPLMLPVPDMEGKRSRELPEISQEQADQITSSGGYLPGGLLGMDPEDPMLPHVSVFDFRTVMQGLMDEEVLSIMGTAEARDKYLEGQMHMLERVDAAIRPLREFETRTHKVMEDRASEGVLRGMENFLRDGAGDPGRLQKKWANSEQELERHVLREVLGEGSDKLLAEYDRIVTGDRILDTPAEFFLAAHVKAGLRAASNWILTQSAAPATEGTMLLSMAKQLMDTQDEQTVANVAGFVEKYRFPFFAPGKAKYTAASEVRIAAGLRRMLGGTRARMTQGINTLERSAPMAQLRADSGFLGRYSDMLVTSWKSNKDENGMPRGLGGPKDLRETMRGELEEEVEGRTLEEIEAMRFRPSPKAELQISTMEAMVELSTLVPGQTDLMMAILSGGYDEDLPSYLKEMQDFNKAELERDTFFASNRAVIEQKIREHQKQRQQRMQEMQGQAEPTPQPGQPQPGQPGQPTPTPGAMEGGYVPRSQRIGE